MTIIGRFLTKNMLLAGAFAIPIATAFAQASSNAAPVILTQPQDQSAPVTGRATFTVAVDQTAVKYQWRKAGAVIARQTNATLVLSNITPFSAGSYSVKISNAHSNVVSRDAVLTVTPGGDLPVIKTEPKGLTVAVGGVATFTTAATSKTALGYQWLFNGTNIPGAKAASYTKKAIQLTNAGSYSVVVSNWGGSVTSEPAILHVVGELVKPTVVITNAPVGGKVYSPTLILGGRAADKSSFKVYYSVNGGDYLEAIGTSNWISAPIPLSAGVNVLRAKAVDVWGNETVASKSVTRASATPLTVQIAGSGVVTPDLSGQYYPYGAKLTLKAVPADGFVFEQWTGGTITNTNASITFSMQSNLVLTATFITNPFIARQGDYYGMVYGGLANNGFVSLTVNSNGVFSSKLLFAADSYSFSGKFDAFCRAYINLPQSGTPKLVSLWGFNSEEVDNELRGRIYYTSSSSVMAYGNRNIYSNQTNPCPYAGVYTMIIPGTDTNGQPYGDGYATVTVQSNGLTRFAGTLADNTPFTMNSGVSSNAQAPFYVTFQKGKESIWGLLSITNGSDSTASSVGIWSFPPSGSIYPAGFTNSMGLVWSAYTAPASGEPVISLTNGVIVFTGGNLAGSLTNAITLTSSNVFTVNKTNILSFNPTNGVVQGSFYHPALKKAVSFSGAVLQSSNTVQGFFLGTNQIGGVRIENQ